MTRTILSFVFVLVLGCRSTNSSNLQENQQLATEVKRSTGWVLCDSSSAMMENARLAADKIARTLQWGPESTKSKIIHIDQTELNRFDPVMEKALANNPAQLLSYRRDLTQLRARHLAGEKDIFSEFSSCYMRQRKSNGYEKTRDLCMKETTIRSVPKVYLDILESFPTYPDAPIKPYCNNTNDVSLTDTSYGAESSTYIYVYTGKDEDILGKVQLNGHSNFYSDREVGCSDDHFKGCKVAPAIFKEGHLDIFDKS